MITADKAVTVDIYNVPGHYAAADELQHDYSIRGVFCEGADCEVTVASLAAYLGLPGIGLLAAKRCKDKSLMREAFARAGVSPVAGFTGRFPVMVKASDNCGSRGVHRVDRQEDLVAAIADAKANSTHGEYLLEEYLTGPQQSVEILFDASGKCHYLNIVDRPFAADGVMELGHINPSGLSEPQKQELYRLTEQAAAAVGVSFGAFKCDTIWTDKGPRILECTARLSGGLDCQYTTPLATGRDFISAAMRIACGMPADPEDLRVKHNRFAAAWAAFPKPGRVKEIWGTPGQRVFIRVKPGDVIEPYTHCATRPAFVVVTGETYSETLSKARAAADVLASYIVTEPV